MLAQILNPFSKKASGSILQHERLWPIYLRILLGKIFSEKNKPVVKRNPLKKVPHFSYEAKLYFCIHLRDQLECQYCFKGRNSLEVHRQKRVLFVVGDSVLTSARQKVIRTEFIPE